MILENLPKKLPSPIFHYIDGAADDEVTTEEIPNLSKNVH